MYNNFLFHEKGLDFTVKIREKGIQAPVKVAKAK